MNRYKLVYLNILLMILDIFYNKVLTEIVIK